MRPIVIVGAGVAGLTAGYELARQGRAVIAIEKEPRVGGLARSFVYGDWTFDVGPHRFFSESVEIRDFISSILQEEAVDIPRRSGVYFSGKYYDWPLHPAALFALPVSLLLRSAADILGSAFRRGCRERDFEEYIVRHYGPTLYRAFFRDYTAKFLGLDPKETHWQWAKTGMKQAVINENEVSRNLWAVLAYMLSRPRPPMRFQYPRSGVGFFCEKLKSLLEARGGRVLTNDRVAWIEVGGNRIERIRTKAGEWIPVEALVSTAPINEICELLDVGRPCLDYRSLVLYNIELSEPPLLPYQWCYFGGRDVVFSRASVPALMSAQACPSGAGGLCVEVACQQGDESWRDAEKWTSRVCADLERTRSIRSRSAVRVVHIERVADAYPRYSLDYEQKLETAKRGLARFVNLTLAGRTGLFWYNNMDDSIANGRQLAGALAGPVEQAA